MNALVSIIVPVYKVENYLDRCIESLVNQTYKNIEILLIDDGSPDKCPEMCDEWALKDDRICVFHKENGGLSDARNVGLHNAHGQYILYVDSDDYLEVDACQRLLTYMKENVDFVVGTCREIHKDRVAYQKHTNVVAGKVYSAQDFSVLSIKNNEWYAPAWLNMYKASFLRKNKLYFKTGYLFEDVEMLPRLFMAAENVVYTDYPFYNYVIRENSITTSKNSSRKAEMVLKIYKDWMNLLKEVEDEVFRRYIAGILIRFYLKNCRDYKITGWKVEGMSVWFALKYALGLRERLKVIVFSIFPGMYIQ